MSRTNKGRNGHSWGRLRYKWSPDGKKVRKYYSQGRGRHGYQKKHYLTYLKRVGNKWERQYVRLELKNERRGLFRRMWEQVMTDRDLEHGLVERALKFFTENGPDLPVEPYERFNRWWYD